MRSMRLIGNSNPRYRWHQYWKSEEELKKMKTPMYVIFVTFSGACTAIHMGPLFKVIARKPYFCGCAFLIG
jgi:hypothetical protein